MLKVCQNNSVKISKSCLKWRGFTLGCMCSVCIVYPCTYNTTERKFHFFFLAFSIFLPTSIFLRKLCFRFANNTNNHRRESKSCRRMEDLPLPALFELARKIHADATESAVDQVRYLHAPLFCFWFWFFNRHASFLGFRRLWRRGARPCIDARTWWII